MFEPATFGPSGKYTNHYTTKAIGTDVLKSAVFSLDECVIDFLLWLEI
jgi:hypothetical protein